MDEVKRTIRRISLIFSVALLVIGLANAEELEEPKELAAAVVNGDRIPMSALEAAVQAAGQMRLAAVTVLTSHSPGGYWDTVGRTGEPDVAAEVERLARLAVDSGVGAVVTSPREVAAAREIAGPDRWLVVPGIRPAGSAADDQRRTADPAAAAQAGATHLVVGRPITRAENPRAVYEAIVEAAS